MKINAERIAQLVNGNVEGDGKTEVSSFGKIEEAKQGQLAFLANPKYEDYLYTTNDSVIRMNIDYILWPAKVRFKNYEIME